MGSAEATAVDLGRLAERADAERDRLLARLAEDCARIDASRPALELCRELVRDHPGADEVIDASRYWTGRAIELTRTQPGALPRRGVPGRPRRVPALGDGDDLHRGAR